MSDAVRSFGKRLDEDAAVRRQELASVDSDLSAMHRTLGARIDALSPEPQPNPFAQAGGPPAWLRVGLTVVITAVEFQDCGHRGVVLPAGPHAYPGRAHVLTDSGTEVAVPYTALAPSEPCPTSPPSAGS